MLPLDLNINPGRLNIKMHLDSLNHIGIKSRKGRRGGRVFLRLPKCRGRNKNLNGSGTNTSIYKQASHSRLGICPISKEWEGWMGMKRGESGQLDSGWDRLMNMVVMGRIKHVLLGHR